MRMSAAALWHAGVAGELDVLCVTVSSPMELALGCLPEETSRVEVKN
jgi:hypothetical protein